MSLTRLARRRAFNSRSSGISNSGGGRDSWGGGGAGMAFSPDGALQCYEVEVYLEGEVDKSNGMIVNIAEVDALLQKLLAPLEGQDLSKTLKVPATTPRLASYLAEQFLSLKGREFKPWLVKLRLYENEDLWVDVWP